MNPVAQAKTRQLKISKLIDTILALLQRFSLHTLHLESSSGHL